MSQERNELDQEEAALQRNDRERKLLLAEKDRLLLEQATTAKRTIPFTPKSLAKQWGCSEHYVRNLTKRGELGHFRVGGKLLRIAADAVEEFECRPAAPIAAHSHDISKSRPSSKAYGRPFCMQFLT